MFMSIITILAYCINVPLQQTMGGKDKPPITTHKCFLANNQYFSKNAHQRFSINELFLTWISHHFNWISRAFRCWILYFYCFAQHCVFAYSVRLEVHNEVSLKIFNISFERNTSGSLLQALTVLVDTQKICLC